MPGLTSKHYFRLVFYGLNIGQFSNDCQTDLMIMIISVCECFLPEKFCFRCFALFQWWATFPAPVCNFSMNRKIFEYLPSQQRLYQQDLINIENDMNVAAPDIRFNFNVFSFWSSVCNVSRNVLVEPSFQIPSTHTPSHPPTNSDSWLFSWKTSRIKEVI